MSELHDRSDLTPLDPGFRDRGYWIRFHAGVMARAQEELSRRRRAREMSVPEVVFQWRRTLVPATLLAAALAGILLLGEGPEAQGFTPVALEEALVVGLEGDPIPTVLQQTAELDEVAFLTAAGGFRP